MPNENKTLPERKNNRLKNYDYSSPGAYFITICTHEKRCILANISVGATIGRPPAVTLTSYGKIVEEAIENIEKYYPAYSVDHYVIMPNHIHLLLQIHADENGDTMTAPTVGLTQNRNARSETAKTVRDGGRAMLAPTVSRVIQQMKGYVSKKAGQVLWQKLFHDHVIRNERDYLRIWNYIDTNPEKWTEDCFYVPTKE